MTTTITTNGHTRELLALADLPESARSEFDYIDEEEFYSPRFVAYRGSWHDVNESAAIYRRSDVSPVFSHSVDDESPLLAWDGVTADTYFSGVVFRYARDEWGNIDPEYVVVGSVYFD